MLRNIINKIRTRKNSFHIVFASVFTLFSYSTCIIELCSKLFLHLFNGTLVYLRERFLTEDNEKMWKCRKCGKAVYFAERKSSLGYDWHPECLRCEECAKRLNPGQHAEHKGVPYCYIPCYGALFGPQLYGHGSRIESHTSFGKARETQEMQQGVERAVLEAKLKVFNNYFDDKIPSNKIQSRTRNGKLILEGSLRIFWDVSNKIHLKEDNDDRIFIIRRQSSYMPCKRTSEEANCIRRRRVRKRQPLDASTASNADSAQRQQLNSPATQSITSTTATSSSSSSSSSSTPSNSAAGTNSSSSSTSSPEKDALGRNYRTLPTGGLKAAMKEYNEYYSKQSIDDEYLTTTKFNESDYYDMENYHEDDDDDNDVDDDENNLDDKNDDDDEQQQQQQARLIKSSIETNGLNGNENENNKTKSNLLSVPVNDAIVESGVTLRKLKRSKVRLKRRCSINGHFYNRETSVFTPETGSVTSVWITSLVNTKEVINLLLDKFKVTNTPEDFALFVIHDTGECKRLQDSDYPLICRVLLGPNEDAVRVFILNKNKTEISSEVAQYINFNAIELQMFLRKFEEEEMKEIERIKRKFDDAKKFIKLRIKELDNSSDGYESLDSNLD